MNFSIIKFSGIEYVNCDLILNDAPIYAKGSRNTRSLIKNKNIPKEQYIFAKKNDDNKWIKSDGKSIKWDKILLKKEYLINIPELNKNDNKIITDLNGIQEAPPIIDLEDCEKFKDGNGNIIEIETRGTRNHDDIYFKVKDISIGFEMAKLVDTIQHKDTKYEKNEDYKFFNCVITDNLGKKTNKQKITKELFLTYTGMLRVLFVSTSGKTKQFIKWATETLFTAQMGSEQQKQQLVSNILGISAQAVREVFKTSAKSIPCVYLFSLGTAKDLRKSMNIDNKYADDILICKYGYTIDLSRRTSEHIKTYGNINGVDLKLKCYSYIDPMYCSNAETDIKDFFCALDIGLKFKDYEELVAIKPHLIKTTENQYKQISDAYAGHMKDMIKKVEDLKNELLTKDLICKNELLTKDNELNMAYAKNTALEKDLEIEKLRNHILLMNKK